jgi:hypothetical protein
MIVRPLINKFLTLLPTLTLVDIVIALVVELGRSRISMVGDGLSVLYRPAALQESRPMPHTDLEMAFEAHKIVFAAERSAVERRPVNLSAL